MRNSIGMNTLTGYCEMIRSHYSILNYAIVHASHIANINVYSLVCYMDVPSYCVHVSIMILIRVVGSTSCMVYILQM